MTRWEGGTEGGWEEGSEGGSEGGKEELKGKPVETGARASSLLSCQHPMRYYPLISLSPPLSLPPSFPPSLPPSLLPQLEFMVDLHFKLPPAVAGTGQNQTKVFDDYLYLTQVGREGGREGGRERGRTA
jgi:hypothetical protein